MPGWTDYQTLDDGRVRLVDDQGGEFFAVPTPSVQQVTAEIDARKAPPPPEPPQLQQPAAMPDPIIAIDGPPQRADFAFAPPAANAPAAPPAGAPAGNPLVPPAPVVNVAPATPGNALVPSAPLVNAAPATPGNALVPGAVAPAAPPAAPAAPAPAAAPADAAPPKIVRAGTGAAPTQEEIAAGLWNRAAEQELRGSPGTFVPGGTFSTGKTVQNAPGPDPGATAARELAERKAFGAQSDLIYVEARKQQEMSELAQAEAARAEERQRQLAEVQAREQAKLEEIFGEIDAKRKDLADTKLDPDKLIKSMSSGRQAVLGIAMALGGLGQAWAGESGPPMAMQIWKEAVANDIENQKYNIEKKRGDINELGKVYQLTKERFGSEKMAQEAAYLAGLEVYKAKLTRTVAEADAAMGVETQYDENGQIVSGAPYSMKAKAALAALAVEQARIRESLSQQANGQVAEQFVTTQGKVVGGKAPNYAKAAEYAEKGAKAAGSGAQQVTYGGQKYKLAPYVEQGEGKKLREDLGDIESTKREVAILEKELKDNPIGSRTYDASRVKGLVERITSKANVILGQGAKNNDEAKRWNDIALGVLTNGVGAVKDMHTWLDDMAKNKLDQVNASPAQQGSPLVIPQSVQDVASGKKTPGGGGVIGLPQQAKAAPPPTPVVRASGAQASPLDRTGAALVQVTTATDDKARAKGVELAKKSLRESYAAGQLGAGEYKVALQMATDGQFEELLDFLGRMRGASSLAAPSRPAPLSDEEKAAIARSLGAQLAMQRVGLDLYDTRAKADAALGVGDGAVTTTVATKTKGKGGGAPAVKTGKFINLSGKKGR